MPLFFLFTLVEYYYPRCVLVMIPRASDILHLIFKKHACIPETITGENPAMSTFNIRQYGACRSAFCCCSIFRHRCSALCMLSLFHRKLLLPRQKMLVTGLGEKGLSSQEEVRISLHPSTLLSLSFCHHEIY